MVGCRFGVQHQVAAELVGGQIWGEPNEQTTQDEGTRTEQDYGVQTFVA